MYTWRVLLSVSNQQSKLIIAAASAAVLRSAKGPKWPKLLLYNNSVA